MDIVFTSHRFTQKMDSSALSFSAPPSKFEQLLGAIRDRKLEHACDLLRQHFTLEEIVVFQGGLLVREFFQYTQGTPIGQHSIWLCGIIRELIRSHGLNADEHLPVRLISEILEQVIVKGSACSSLPVLSLLHREGGLSAQRVLEAGIVKLALRSGAACSIDLLTEEFGIGGSDHLLEGSEEERIYASTMSFAERAHADFLKNSLLRFKHFAQ